MGKAEKKLAKSIEREIEEQTWYVDYVAEDMDAVATRGYIDALEWVLNELCKED